jgi:uncharacterized damage-inducible protein DinB
MTPSDHPAAFNLAALDQGMELIRRLDDEAWTHDPRPFRGGVGAQFRHCLDFHHCLLEGLASGRIDYARRERDARVERERTFALVRFQAVRDRLAALDAGTLDREVAVRAEDDAVDDEAAWSRSTVRRELQFLASHTIHHHALIVLLLRLQGSDAADRLPQFGVAPSTLRHWIAADSAPR